MSSSHLIVAKSPLYLLGLESVISRYMEGSLISFGRSAEEARQKLLDGPRGFLWWAIQDSSKDEISAFRAAYPRLFILFLQEKIDIEAVKELFDLGITGCLSYLCTPEDICEAATAALSGQRYLDRRVAGVISHNLLDRSQPSGSSEALTIREKEVLTLIVDEYTTREIAEKLHISKCTVETHRLHLIRKLGVKNMAGLVREALTQSLCSRIA